MKVLVVGDEPDLQFLSERTFKRRIAAGELSFVFTRNGIEALEQLFVRNVTFLRSGSPGHVNERTFRAIFEFHL